LTAAHQIAKQTEITNQHFCTFKNYFFINLNLNRIGPCLTTPLALTLNILNRVAKESPPPKAGSWQGKHSRVLLGVKVEW